MIFYQFIENLSRLICEWAIRKQKINRNILDVIADDFSYHPMRGRSLKKALL